MIWVVLIILFVIFLILAAQYFDAPRYVSIEHQNIREKEKEYGCKKKARNCIISLTTTPARIFKMRPTLISLLDQSLAVEEIRINVPYTSCKGEEYVVPSWLSDLKYVKVCRVGKDWGPATKILPTLLDPNTDGKRIIVVDDDVIYGYHTIVDLVQTFDKYDGKAAVTIYGDEILPCGNTDNGLLTRFNNYMQANTRTDILRGHAGYMVTKDMFTKDLYNYKKYPKECFFVDDNYLSFHLHKNKVKIIMIGASYRSIPLPEMASCNTGALHQGANHDGRNERIVNRLRKRKVTK